MNTVHDLLLDMAGRFGSAEDFKVEAAKVYSELTGQEVDAEPEERSLYTVADVAKRWGCTETHVRRQIKGGTLKAMRLGKGYRVTPAELVAYEKRSACRNGALIH